MRGGEAGPSRRWGCNERASLRWCQSKETDEIGASNQVLRELYWRNRMSSERGVQESNGQVGREVGERGPRGARPRAEREKRRGSRGASVCRPLYAPLHVQSSTMAVRWNPLV